MDLQGTLPGHEHSYCLDAFTVLDAGRATAVSGNTAAALGEGGVSWLSRHFQVHQLPCARPPFPTLYKRCSICQHCPAEFNANGEKEDANGALYSGGYGDCK